MSKCRSGVGRLDQQWDLRRWGWGFPSGSLRRQGFFCPLNLLPLFRRRLPLPDPSFLLFVPTSPSHFTPRPVSGPRLVGRGIGPRTTKGSPGTSLHPAPPHPHPLPSRPRQTLPFRDKARRILLAASTTRYPVFHRPRPGLRRARGTACGGSSAFDVTRSGVCGWATPSQATPEISPGNRQDPLPRRLEGHKGVRFVLSEGRWLFEVEMRGA